MGILRCPFPCRRAEDSTHQSPSSHLHSESSSSSSLYSQSSLPSVPSLTPPPHDQPAASRHHCAATLRAHSSHIFSLSLAGKHLFSGTSEGELRIWPRDPSPASTLHGTAVASTNSAVKALAVLGGKLFTAHQDHKIRVWKMDLDAGSGGNQQFKCVATLPTVQDRVARLFFAKNYVEVRRHKKCTWVHHVDTVSGLAVSRDGYLLYSASWDRTFKVWRTADFKCLESVRNAHDDAINALALSTDGFVYTGSADKKIKVWKKQEGEEKHSLVATLEKHKSAVNALALSTDGSVLYSGACDRSIIVWEKGCGGGGGGEYMAVAGALRGHGKAILCLAVVADVVFSGSADKTVRIWRRTVERSYCCLAVLEGHRGPVKCLTAAVDGSCSSSGDSNSCSGNGTCYKVYSGSLDCDIKVWQIWVPSL
ncbi:protein JINGUBANG-like [Diospyros lotus]|uniref:protein JINGUBANG-like n=1 Tax=Diospyros lotus TaxID=55363 RepID=UPI00225A3CCC|nr:protein JINGUBANG-like [Diospyros lotus]